MSEPPPCCVPSKQRAARLEASRQASATRQRAHSGSTEEMARLDGGRFLMGTEDDEGFPADGEGPIREVTLDPFWMDRYPVSNEQFHAFARATNFQTEAERFGWSFVFHKHIPAEQQERLVKRRAPGVRWWCVVDGADWRHPEGPRLLERCRHLCRVGRQRLPTEAEWQFAARGGLEQQKYPWGDELTPVRKHLCNIWQGEFPNEDTAEDGYSAPAPGDAFPPNGYGIRMITGSVREWCSDWFAPSWHVTATRVNPLGPADGSQRVMRGGSYLCHKSYCNGIEWRRGRRIRPIARRRTLGSAACGMCDVQLPAWLA